MKKTSYNNGNLNRKGYSSEDITLEVSKEIFEEAYLLKIKAYDFLENNDDFYSLMESKINA